MSQMRRERRSGSPKPEGLMSRARKGAGAVLRRTGSRLGRIGMGSLDIERIRYLPLEIPVGVQSGTPGIQLLPMIADRAAIAQAVAMPFPLSMGGVHPQHTLPAGRSAEDAGWLFAQVALNTFVFLQ